MGNFNPQTEKILAVSTEQYRELLQYAESLLKRFDSCDYSQVENYVVRLKQLQGEATLQDEKLLPLLMLERTVWQKHTLYQKRLDYINSIVELNKLLLPKVHSVMAVASSELSTLSGGRNALSGYAAKEADKRVFSGVG